jgi:hypothetical protein
MDMKHKILAVVIGLLLMCGNAMALTTAETFPTTNTVTSSDPHSDNTWVSPENAYGENDTYASITDNSYDNGDQSYLLFLKGFDFSSLPADAVITGVTAKINMYYATGTNSIDYLYLLNASGAVQGDNKASTAIALSATSTDIKTVGSSSDTWGATLNYTVLTDADFGICIGNLATGNNSDIYLDYISLTVDYTSASSASGQLIMCD